MAEYIEKSAAMREIYHSSGTINAYLRVASIHAADVVEVKHGRWIIDKSFIPFVCTCSKCGWSTDTDGAFEWKGCPYCLARMDGE